MVIFHSFVKLPEGYQRVCHSTGDLPLKESPASRHSPSRSLVPPGLPTPAAATFESEAALANGRGTAVPAATAGCGALGFSKKNGGISPEEMGVSIYYIWVNYNDLTATSL